MKKNLIKRLYYPNDIKINITISLSKEQSHYVKNVLRLELNNKILLFNDSNGEFSCIISFMDKKNVHCTPISLERTIYKEPYIRLIFAPIKNGKIENIIQKATELGATIIQPAITERTIVNKINGEKLRLTAIEAAEQCERVTIPQIERIDKLTNIINGLDDGDILFFCNETGNGESISISFNKYKDKTNKKFSILIGPEGGFTEKEVAILSDNDFTIPVTMGPRILRADTAAISALACFSSIIGDWCKLNPDFRYKKTV